jgi:serine O-acetyltransferase
MTIDASSPRSVVWPAIVAEAEKLRANAIVGRSVSAAIFDHGNLEDALAFQIGQGLGSGDDRESYADAARQALRSSPAIADAACADLDGIRARDPAFSGFLPVFLNAKGYIALQAWRVSNWLWLHERRDLALLFQNAASHALQISIHPSAAFGRGVFLDHGTGIVVGAGVQVGDDVTILQNVTLGRGKAGGGAPVIGRGVLLSADASIIGDVIVGDFAKIGAGSVVTMDVPAGCTAVGVPAQLVNCPSMAS